MKSFYDFEIAHRNHEPATDWSADSHVREFRSEDSCGQSCPRSEQWFMGGFNDTRIAHCDHEPKRACLGAVASWTAAALRRFANTAAFQSARGLAQSKTWR